VLYTTPKVVLCADCQPDASYDLLAEVEAITEDVQGVEQGDEQTETDAGADGTDNDQTGSGDETAQVDSSTEETQSVIATELAQLDVVNAPRVIDERNAYIMGSMMRDVVSRGTARRAGEALGRKDLAGKTGTSNNQLDAWFTGFNSQVVAAAWVGSDGLEPLGRKEAGGVAALPMWSAFISKILADVPEDEFTPPAGIQTVRVDTATGEPASGDGTVMELFLEDTAPTSVEQLEIKSGSTAGNSAVTSTSAAPKSTRDQKSEVESLF